MVLRAVLLAFAFLALPFAGAQSTNSRGSQVAIDSVDHPALVVAQKAFALGVHLENKESSAVEVNLLAALYATDAQKSNDCGAATASDTYWRGFTHRLMPDFTIPAGGRFDYPPAGDTPWWQIVNQSWVGIGQGTFELCVFATAKLDPHQGITYFDYATFHLTVRGENKPPSASFTWTPATPQEVQFVTFTANATDADHDNLTYAWDFGYFGVNGRARGDGRVVETRFYPTNDYVVNLTVSDGFDSTTVTHVIHVVPEPRTSTTTPPPATPRGLLPAPGAAMLVALAASAAVLVRRRPRRD